jgi:hypothetical protein
MVEINEEDFLMVIWGPVYGIDNVTGVREQLYAQMIGLDEED